jgi:predicted dehydrogenase
VCAPNDTHVDIGLAVAQAGKHLLMEKPLAITVDGAQRLELTFRERNLVLMGAHTHRFYDYGRTIKRTIDSGDIGRPVYAWHWVGGSGPTARLMPIRAARQPRAAQRHPPLDLATW